MTEGILSVHTNILKVGVKGMFTAMPRDSGNKLKHRKFHLNFKDD